MNAFVKKIVDEIGLWVLGLLNKKISRISLFYWESDNTIKDGEGNVLTYEQIVALVDDSKNFVTLQDSDSSYLLPHYEDGGAIIFTGLDVFSAGDYTHRIAINLDNEIKRNIFESVRLKEVVSIGNDVTSVMLDRNKMYKFKDRTANLTLTLPYMPSELDDSFEFHFFIYPTGTPTINWPSNMEWNGGSAPTITAGKKYEISIMNYVAAFFEI